MKRFSKVISAIVAASIVACASAVNASALCVKDIFSIGNGCGYGNTCGITSLVQCIKNGNCNTTPTTGSCTGSNCNQTAPTTTVKSAKPTTTTTTTTEVQAVLALVNKERKAAGLGTVTLYDELCKVADVRPKEIVKSFSHTRPNGTSCFTAFKENGVAYRYAGENIAYGQKTATEVMNGWMNSTGHRANILNKNFGKIGIACYNFNGVKYWVQLFTN